jgi:hypothetical protein
MKNLVSALISSLGAMVNVVIVWLIFAILGVSLFSGKLYECENHLLESEIECNEHGYQWKDADFSFDNVLEAFLTLFEVSLLDLWQEIMYSCIDAREQDLARVRDYNIAASYSTSLWRGIHEILPVKERRILCSLTIPNTKPAVLVDMQKLIIKSTPLHDIIKEPNVTFRRFTYNLATSAKFEIFIILVSSLA